MTPPPSPTAPRRWPPALRRRGRPTAICLGLIALYFLIPAEPRLPAGAIALRVLATLATVLLLAWIVLRALRQQWEGVYQRVDGLLVSITLVVLVFALSFYLLNRQDPGQVSGLHTRVDALYFAMSTLSTAGYGDVHAHGQAARALVTVQLVFNLAFLTTAGSIVSSRFREAVVRRGQAPRA